MAVTAATPVTRLSDSRSSCWPSPAVEDDDEEEDEAEDEDDGGGSAAPASLPILTDS